MAGHSKWANIQHRKKAQDAKRGKIFTRLIREITVAARMGGGDINANARLRAAIETAKAANMPNDTIDRAVKKGSGALGDTVLEEIRYEGYGPGGIAVLVDCMADNKKGSVNRDNSPPRLPGISARIFLSSGKSNACRASVLSEECGISSANG